jgi:geranylgeranyl diphosphate synthase type I
MPESGLHTIDMERARRVLDRYRAPVLEEMRRAVGRAGREQGRLMRYHLGWEDAGGATVESSGGKMLRPALCLLACEAGGGNPNTAMPAAAALELLHNFSLIHDDIEDGSTTRHGRESLWRMSGVAQAINAGDGMFVLARRGLLDMHVAGADAGRTIEATRVLDAACVSLCEGQHLDIAFEGRDSVSLDEYEAMIAGKTAALIGASMAIGAIAAGADTSTSAALGECGRMLGMAFQVRDDVLGIWGEEEMTGKPVADDIRSKKKSYPVVWAFEHAAADVRDPLARLYGDGEMDDRRLDAVLALLEESGARGAADREAERWANYAVVALSGVELVKERRDDIEALAAFFVRRRK